MFALACVGFLLSTCMRAYGKHVVYDKSDLTLVMLECTELYVYGESSCTREKNVCVLTFLVT